ncbi:MAG: ribonuclease H-like domain-containing protein [Lachnospiraceae bacterium]|nr:ribonuclease H-like domain-containing protein [Lachnospiraceae bacterium]
MLTIKEPVSVSAEPILPEGISPEQCLYFDIETTGLSPDTSSLYLISSLRQQGGVWTLSQWFADDYDSEPLLLAAFGEELAGIRCAVQYNGDMFDVPYLEAKWRAHGQPYTLEGILHWDIYRKLRPCGFLLDAPNLKLKTMERLMGICREDPYDGGELITVYGTFLRAHYCRKPADEFLAPLLLHNREDVLSLPKLTELLAYPQLLEGHAAVTGCRASDGELCLTLRPAHSLPRPLHFRAEHFTCDGSDDLLVFRVPLREGELKYFFPDYKDYYYLTAEDMAVHKSVGEFVDSAYRRKATAATCYQRRAGLFLPADAGCASGTRPLFREEYKSKANYLLWEEALADDPEFLKAYSLWLLSGLTKKNRL